jgi:hypothetical protein
MGENHPMPDYLHRGLRINPVLPFAISAEDRTRPFSKDTEMAAILYMAEADREKGEGILRKSDEKLVFITEACYPLWLAPWNGGTLVFDGLGITKHTLSYDTLVDIKTFNKHIKYDTKTTRAFTQALAQNTRRLKNSTNKQQKTFEALIADPELIQDLTAYLAASRWKTEKPTRSRAVLSPIISRAEVTDAVRELSELRATVNNDSKHIDTSMKMLNQTTKQKVREIRKQVKNTRKQFNTKTTKTKRTVARRIRRIQHAYNARIKGITKRHRRQLQLLHKRRTSLKKTQRHLLAEIHRLQTKVNPNKRGKSRANKARWVQRIEKTKKRLSATQKKLKQTLKEMRNIEAIKKLQISQLGLEREAHIDQAAKILTELQATRQVVIKRKQQEIKPLLESASQIAAQLNEVAESKKNALHKLDKIKMPARKKKTTLVYVPLYFVRYEKDRSKRYAVYPPAVVGNMGIITRMKSALGAQKMKTLLQPRSKALTEFLNQLVTLIQKNPLLERELTDAGIHDSILRRRKLRIAVKRGLKELKSENWITRNENQTLSKLLYMYA